MICNILNSTNGETNYKYHSKIFVLIILFVVFVLDQPPKEVSEFILVDFINF